MQCGVREILFGCSYLTNVTPTVMSLTLCVYDFCESWFPNRMDAHLMLGMTLSTSPHVRGRGESFWIEIQVGLKSIVQVVFIWKGKFIWTKVLYVLVRFMKYFVSGSIQSNTHTQARYWTYVLHHHCVNRY